MNQMSTPEAMMTKVNEHIKNNEQYMTMSLIFDYLNNSKKKAWNGSMENLILKFIEWSISEGNLKYLKEALNFYKNLSQNGTLTTSSNDSFSTVLSKTKDMVEAKFYNALKSFKDVQIEEIGDWENDEENDLLLDSASQSKEKEDFINCQKFIWETYKVLLDITKTNSKLFSLYSQILKAAFDFCRENKRTVEFKRLSDSVRNYWQTLIKSEKRSNFANKVKITDSDTLRTWIQMRINQIETATDLEQWLEAFKTAEDINFWMDKYEKNTEDSNKKSGQGEKSKKTTKKLTFYKMKFYSSIEKLFWIGNYPMYHSYTNIMMNSLCNSEKYFQNEKHQEKIETFKLKTLSDKIILSVLATPIKNAYTNYTKIGEDMYEQQNDTEIETCKRMMNILKLNHVPNRDSLVEYILNNNILNTCLPQLKQLFNIFEHELNPISIAKNSLKLFNFLESNDPENVYKKYLPLLRENIVIKSIVLFSKTYESISFERLNKLFQGLKIDEITLEDIICEVSRINWIKCKINHSTKLIQFNTIDFKTDELNNRLKSFLMNFKSVVREINYKINANKLSQINKVIYEKVKNEQNDGITLTNVIMDEIDNKQKELKSFNTAKELVKNDLREKTQADREKLKLQKIEQEKLEKDELKNAQRKKEYEIQVKKYVIDILRRYTNSIVVQGKRWKWDDLLKDLNKITEEEIIKSLEEQENEFKLKKEKKLRQVTKSMDYKLREFRKLDNIAYMNKLTVEEKEFNETIVKQSEEYFKEKIGMKDSWRQFKEFKDAYFNKLQEKSNEQYKQEMDLFFEEWNKKVEEDIYKELSASFKTYFDDFKKTEEEANAEKSKKGTTWFRGSKFNSNSTQSTFERSKNAEDPTKRDNKQSMVSSTAGFNRSGNYNPNEVIQKPTVDVKKDLGFQRGVNVVPSSEIKKPEPKKDIAFQRGINAEPPKKEGTSTGFQRGTNVVTVEDKKVEPKKDIVFQRGANVAQTEDKKDTGFQRGTKEAPKKDAPTGFQRGTNVEPKKETGGFARGSNAQAPPTKKAEVKKDTSFQRGTNAEPPKKETTGFNRAGNAEDPKKKDNKKK